MPERMGETPECDFSLLLSQELIAKVMESYLNKTMLRQAVEVVDLQNTEAGYVFSLKQKPKVTELTPPPSHRLRDVVDAVDRGAQHQTRARNGRFTPLRKDEVPQHG